jgi:glycosyltransferase involved in cell wall biosynthesis
MKIAYINTSQVPSMTANSGQVMKVCQALAQVNGPVCLWVPGREQSPWSALAEQYGLETSFEVHWVPALPFWHSYDFAWRAVSQAKAWDASLVYTRGLQVAATALLRGLPVILEQHLRITGFSAPWLFRLFLRWPGKKRLLVITRALLNVLETSYRLKLKPEEIQIAPSGVDLERFIGLPDPASARRQLGFPEGITAAYTGNFYAGRGLDLLFGLAQCFPSVSFLWMGGKPDEVVSWQSRLNQAGMKNVILTGFIANRRLPLYQAAADILLMPYERVIRVSGGGDTGDICSPIKMFEYLASGRAILSSDLPVLREVLNPGNAVLCPPEDLPAWQKGLAGLLADPALRGRLGEQAKVDARQYSWRARAQRALQGLISAGNV